MKFSIITLFPEVLKTVFDSSIVGRGQKKGHLEFEYIDLRQFGLGTHQVVDGKPYGGGVGLVLRADVLEKAIQSIERVGKSIVILPAANGQIYHQSTTKELLEYDHIIVICGHYEGVDQRFIDQYVDLELCIGDFVLTGGEIPTMLIVDSIARLVPGVLEKPEAHQKESFENDLLEHPHYTRPDTFNNQTIPEVLMSGHHGKVEEWRHEQQIEKTQKVRPDLIKKD